MDITIAHSTEQMAAAAASKAASVIRESIRKSGDAVIVVATGTSQLDMLARLTEEQDIDWAAVDAFHLDEYIGLPETHPASFRRYLRERLVKRLPALRSFHAINGEANDPAAECRRLGELIRARAVDLCLAGIGENGHLAFNDPPADFTTTDPYLVVDLDERCRRQQLGEGWFTALEEVPRRAISMSVRQILASRVLVVTVPDSRKAEAAKAAVEGPVTPACPASALQEHENCFLYLDSASASLLSARP
ncbi:glucosamine-6-phosphate deaminase [Salinispira pacifica]